MRHSILILLIVLFTVILVSTTWARKSFELADVSNLTSYWLDPECAPPDWCEEYDFDRDGGIGIHDFTILSTGWQLTCTDDADCDGLSDNNEAALGTNSNDPDSDGDGLTDGEEVNPNHRTGVTIQTLTDSGGTPLTSIIFSTGGIQTVYIEVPVWDDALEYISWATMTLTGQTDGSSYPSHVLVDVGSDWKSWDIFNSRLLDWQRNLTQINNQARGSGGAMAIEDGIGQTFRVLKTTDVRGFALLMEFLTAGDYDYGIQDASGQWLSGFPQTHTVSSPTGIVKMISFPFANNVNLTRGTEYILAVIEKTDLGSAPIGYSELVDNPYPYGGFLFGADSTDPSGWDTQNSPANSDLTFHLFREFTGSETTFDLSAGCNRYLSSHSGPYVSQVRIPVDVYSATAGTIDFSNVEIEMVIVTTDPTDTDSDGDGLVDGWTDADADLVYDSGETKGEKLYATNPADTDTDGDGKGLDDFEELNDLYDITLPTGSSSSHTGDPLRPDLLVELDAMTGFSPNDKMMFETQTAYEDLGITLRYKTDQTGITPATISSDAQEESYLFNHTHYADYAHLFFADTNGGTSHGTTHYAAPNQTTGTVTHGNSPDPRYAGTFVFQQNINNDYSNHQSEFSPVGVTLDLLSARTIIHELGHIVGCMHETGNNGWDYTNVMIQNGNLGDPASTISRWESNVLGTRGSGPRFSTAAAEQIDLSFKPSVETGLDPKNRRFDFGTSTSAIFTGNLQVLITDSYSQAVRHGWETNAAPDTASENGGANSDDFYDIVEHSTDGSPVQFRVSGLGQAKLTVRVFLGKGRLTSLTSDITVQARVLGRTSTTYETTTINQPMDSDSLYLDAPSFTYPVPFRDSSIIIDFTDDASTSPAPIEYLRVTKRDI